LTVEQTPLDAERLKKLDARSGYGFKTRLAPGIAVGPFMKKIKVRTDIDGETVIDIVVRALRPGPLRFLPAIAVGGAQWHSDAMRLSMNRFSAAAGKTVYLPLFVSGMNEDFKLLTFESNVDFLTVSLDTDEGAEAGSRKLYRLKFEMPPGKPAMTRTTNDPGRVKLKTNHPQAGEIEIEVIFISQ
jgi:hypothetical protein